MKTDHKNTIEQNVMASVGTIYTVRRLVSATALKVYVLVASIYALGVLVWVARIEQNFLAVAHGGAWAVGNYVLVALTHTTTVVQMVLVVAFVAFLGLAADLLRSISPQQHYRV